MLALKGNNLLLEANSSFKSHFGGVSLPKDFRKKTSKEEVAIVVSPQKNGCKTCRYMEYLYTLKCVAELQIRLGIKDNLKITFLISQNKVREKYLENEIFSRSGKSQGILWMVREI